MINRKLSFYELLYQYIKEPSNIPRHIPETINFSQQYNLAEIFKIHNVAEYFWQNEKDDWRIDTDFINLAPPFPSFWMEYNLSNVKHLHCDGEYISTPDSFKDITYGALILSREIYIDKKRDGWEMQLIYCSKWMNEYHVADYVLFLRVNEDGSVHKNNIQAVAPNELIIEFGYDEINKLCFLLYPMLLAITFLHCKNVEIIDHNTGAKNNRKRYGPKIQFKTLAIAPIKHILEQTGKNNNTNLKLSMHICRGHFKDFSKGNGLFGRYKGIFWWNHQIRGHSEAGIVIKDYEVNNAS